MKLYSDEAGAEEIRAIESLVVSRICRVEIPAALWGKERAGELEASEVAVLIAAFGADYDGTTGSQPRFLVIGIEDQVLTEAAVFSRLHRLRAYDAVQLASATVARRADPDCTDFACFDQALRLAAAVERFKVVPAAT